MEQANLVSLRRKTRYTAVFLGLVLALCVITVLNKMCIRDRRRDDRAAHCEEQ